MAAEVFKAAGYRAIEACNAAEAMTILESCGDIETVFTDIEMPGQITGVSLARAICQRWPHIRVLVTSGTAISRWTALCRSAPVSSASPINTRRCSPR
ncbi:MAG: response regulator [Pseudomonadota bacterium]|uniref:response regulator n=1 Tax=Novosphingobium sp. CCH12-A3 TaxID=1768752 RepID=UPI001E42B9AB|nr:response regulator [Novosphingobium sp. CCH12-A3]